MNQLIERARLLLEIESKAVSRAASRLDESFVKAIGLIDDALLNGKKVVLSGMGKSHYVAAKLAASFVSTGVTALFIHPAEAFHGDLGAIQSGDVVLMFSKSGATAELLGLFSVLQGRNPIISIVGDLKSPLALKSTVCLDASVEKEACPINMLPTASTTVALALGDALVSTFAERRGFSKQTFAGYHPGGSIGKRLHLRVKDVYSPLEKVATGKANCSLQELAGLMGAKPLGAFCVVGDMGELLGLITDGDMRRAVAAGKSLSTPASQLMNPKPTILDPELLIDDAIACLEQVNRRLNCAPIVDAKGTLLGLVHIHDLI